MRKQLLNKRYRDLVKAEARVDALNEKRRKASSKKEQNPERRFWSDREIKLFTLR
jgi:hypothetical protein